MGVFNNVGKILDGKKIGLSGALGIGMNAYFGISGYKEARSEGHGVVGSAAKSLGDIVMMDALGIGPTLGLQALQAGPKLLVKGYEKGMRIARDMDRLNRNVPFVNSTFNDTRQAYTMRQAGMQLAENSKYNLQQTLMGNEASSMHIV